MNFPEEDIDDANQYLLLVSNATADGLPHLFSNKLITEIDGTDKEMGLINANLPNCWHSITPADVSDQRFLLKVRTAVSVYASWRNLIPILTNNYDHLQPFCSNAMIGTFPSGVSYDSVREYLTKGIMAPINNMLVSYKLPFTLINLHQYGEKACLNASRYSRSSWHVDILVNAKALAALKIPQSALPTRNFYYKSGNAIELVTSSSTPTDDQRWYQISCDSANLKVKIDIPTALPHTTLENRFQMFYVYAENLETRFVGNNQYRLLTTIPEPSLKSRDGAISYSHRPPYPIYFPMESRIHKSIDVEIKDDQDKPIYFEWGVTSFLVHIRTVKDV